jgi:hypothetical protein
MYDVDLVKPHVPHPIHGLDAVLAALAHGLEPKVVHP